MELVDLLAKLGPAGMGFASFLVVVYQYVIGQRNLEQKFESLKTAIETQSKAQQEALAVLVDEVRNLNPESKKKALNGVSRLLPGGIHGHD